MKRNLFEPNIYLSVYNSLILFLIENFSATTDRYVMISVYLKPKKGKAFVSDEHNLTPTGVSSPILKM